MGLEDLTGAAKFIDDLVNTNPVGSTDTKSTLDDHIRGVKNVLLNSMPNITGAINATQAELNLLVGATAGLVFASGTLMLFQQTSAPTGWTKETTHNNKALRVVTGSVSSGGASSFTTTFGTSKTTDSHALSLAESPIHDHDLTLATRDGSSCANNPGGTYFSAGNCIGAGGNRTGTTTSKGSGSGHTHNLSNFDLQYVDLIIAAKD